MSYFKGPSRPIGPRYRPKPKKSLGRSLPGVIIYTKPKEEPNAHPIAVQ